MAHSDLQKWVDTVREVDLTGSLTIEKFQQLKLDLQILDLACLDRDKSIILTIDSKGGIVGAALDLYEFIRDEIRCPVVGRVKDEASCSSLIVLQACDVREAYWDSTFCFKEISGFDLPREAILTNPRLVMEVTGQANRQFIKIILSRCDEKNMIDMIKFILSEEKVSAPEALKCGLIDRIIEEEIEEFEN